MITALASPSNSISVTPPSSQKVFEPSTASTQPLTIPVTYSSKIADISKPSVPQFTISPTTTVAMGYIPAMYLPVPVSTFQSRIESYECLSSPLIEYAHRTPCPEQSQRHSSIPVRAPEMTLSSNYARHTLSVELPKIILPEMVMICANRGNRLKVSANAWSMPSECHYEWHITFPPDVEVNSASGVSAKIKGGVLTVEIRRRYRIS